MSGLIECLIADQDRGIQTVVDVAIQIDPDADRAALAHLARAIGTGFSNSQWLVIEAVRVKTENNLGVFSVYDLARQFFGMGDGEPLKVGQMREFRTALTLDRVH
jgi:hypothetical protein